MDTEEALQWVDRYVSDESFIMEMRSKVVARTLADEVRALRAENAKLRALVIEA
jgi:hypothetical protein